MPRAPTPQATLERRADGDRAVVVRVAGRLRVVDGAWLLREARAAVAGGTERVVLDLSALERADGGALALLVELRRELEAAGRAVTLQGARPALAPLVALLDAPGAAAPPRRARGVVEQLGAATRGLLREAGEALAFLGALARALPAAARAPRSVPWRELPGLVAAAGADALPIVLTINLLVGLILGFQAASQLHRFGADIYTADLVGLAVVRELGPIMTAIIVCGRSGAAYAATLASMKVGEEVDALTVLGFDPLRFLVLPRALALALALPALTLLADVVGVLGGLAVGVLGLDLAAAAYVAETRAAMGPWDVGQGLLKSGAFAVTIALVACQQGLAAGGGAEGVGRRTTSAVVATILLLVALDAAFSALFFAWDR